MAGWDNVQQHWPLVRNPDCVLPLIGVCQRRLKVFKAGVSSGLYCTVFQASQVRTNEISVSERNLVNIGTRKCVFYIRMSSISVSPIPCLLSIYRLGMRAAMPQRRDDQPSAVAMAPREVSLSISTENESKTTPIVSEPRLDALENEGPRG